MTLALAGAHRSGKSTLAKLFGKHISGTYVPSRAGEIFTSMGLVVGQDLTFDDRMELQEQILEAHIIDVKIAATNGIAITDRSTIDMAAYTMAEWGMHASEERSPRLLKYVARCLSEASWLYSAVVIIQPGIPYVAEPGKPPPSPAFQELMNTLCFAYMRDSRQTAPGFFMKRDTIDLNERLESLIRVWAHVCSKIPAVQGVAATMH